MKFLFLLLILSFFSLLQAKEVPFTLEDRDRLVRMEAELKALSKSVDVRFEESNKRMDTRFEETNRRMDAKFEEVNRKIDMLFNFLWILTGIFTTITVATIGFAIWDRRTTTKSLDDRVKKLEEKEKAFMDALKELAKKDREVYEILRRYNLI